MNYQDGGKIQLLDEVECDTGVVGSVVGFDIINGREFVEVRGDNGKFWATTNTVHKLVQD